jgi:hypothetical protein
VATREQAVATHSWATDKAISLLHSCAERRCSNIVSINVEPDFDVLRSDPRFQKLQRLIHGPRPADRRS